MCTNKVNVFVVVLQEAHPKNGLDGQLLLYAYTNYADRRCVYGLHAFKREGFRCKTIWAWILF